MTQSACKMQYMGLMWKEVGEVLYAPINKCINTCFMREPPQLYPLQGKNRTSLNLEMDLRMYQTDPSIMLWINLHCFDLQKVVGPRRAH